MKASLLRTMIFVPAYLPKYLEKATNFKVDALILDIEDSVPHKDKRVARTNIRTALESQQYPQKIFLRVNSRESGLLEQDLIEALHPQVTGLMVTKSKDEADISYYEALLEEREKAMDLPRGKFLLCPLIETSMAVLRAYEIASVSDRVIALAFGGEDYLTDLDGLHKEHGASLLVPRSLIVIAARAAKKEVVDTPYLDVNDLTGFRREVELARELGFTGTMLLHPNQIDIANEVFTPSQADVKESLAIMRCIAASEEEGLGVTLYDGKLIGPPMQKRAERILERAGEDQKDQEKDGQR